jgi:DNA gyrase/topoisomerase IV subunit A
MIRKDDIKWWVAEAEKHPEAAPSIVETLADRLIALDEENERLRDEIIRLERRAPGTAVDSEEVSTLRDKVSTLQALVNGDVSDEPCLMLLSDQMQSVRVALAQVHKLARAEQSVLNKGSMLRLRRVLLARPHEELLLLTSLGRGFAVPAADAPILEGEDWPAFDGLELGENEWLTGAVAVTRKPRFWTIVTRRGFVRQMIRIDFDRRVEKGEPLVESPFRRDVPVAVVDGDDGDLMLVTRWGKGIRFPQRSIESAGATALEMDDDDEIVAALPLRSDDEQVLVVTAASFAVRRGASQFEPRPRPGGKSKPFIQAFDVLNAFACKPEDRLLYLTYSGKLVLASIGDIPLYTRSGKGSPVYGFDRDPAVGCVLLRGE